MSPVNEPRSVTELCRYKVRGSFAAADVADRFVAWMQEEHGAELLAAPGCMEFRVYRPSACLVDAEYLFASKSDLESYLSSQAPALRAKSRARFPETVADFTREVAPLVAAGLRPDKPADPRPVDR
mgnify:CR=1 FL=1